VNSKKTWQCDGKPKNGKSYPGASGAHATHENALDTLRCDICGLPREAVSKRWPQFLPLVAVPLLLLGGVGLGMSALKGCPGDTTRQGLSCAPITSVGTDPLPLKDLKDDKFSRGDRVFFDDEGSTPRDSAVEAYAAGKYQEAERFFAAAVQESPRNPEVQIYLNNAKARSATSSPFTVAVVVPITNGEDKAAEMLRGVADAQTAFNEKRIASGQRSLEVVIVNDGNDATTAAEVARKIAAVPEILGVVGHNSSGASGAALPAYEQAGLAMISPTSTSVDIKSEYFFRTVPSDAVAGKRLAEYALDTLDIRKVVAFYDSSSGYSKSLLGSFKSGFEAGGGEIGEPSDLREMSVGEGTVESQAQEIVRAAVQQDQVTTGVLFPSTESVPTSLVVTRGNSALPAGERLDQWLAGDALYVPKALVDGGESVAGMVLAVSWFSDDAFDYAQQATNRWGGRVSWRTANSYDAAQAFVTALAGEDVSREGVWRFLSNDVSLQPGDTAGNPLNFDAAGEREQEPVLVEVKRGGENRPTGSDYSFQLLD